jgi:hypothetical protein
MTQRSAPPLPGLPPITSTAASPGAPEPEPSDPPGLPQLFPDDSRPRIRARGTPGAAPVPDDPIRTVFYAPEPERAAWIEGELARSPVPITIQVGRRVRAIVKALVQDPPPRPQVLIVDFDSISPAQLLDLHVIRDEGWSGRLICLGTVPVELRASLAIDHVLPAPLVRDSLLDCVAGTNHATQTVPIPTFWLAAIARDRK